MRDSHLFFNIQSYLDNRGVPYKDSGDNVSSGWLGIECPFCPDGDHEKHLGVNLTSKVISCWRCGITGTVLKLVRRLEHGSISEVIRRFTDGELPSFHIEEPSNLTVVNPELLEHSEDELDSLHRNWLESRKFDPEFIFEKYKLKCFGPIGRYKLRLFVPFYRNNYLITFTTRDVTNLAKIPYVHCDKKDSVVDPKRYLYNIDTVKDTALVVEGPTDVWRIGDGTVATMGIQHIVEQLYLLKIKQVRRLFLMYDFEKFAQDSAEKLAYAASTFIPEVEIYELSEGDPADLTEQDVKSLRREIFGKVY
ncbi:hypothetical protein DRH13_06085 [Candidatus Woesebacteria bacterium]|nr:MAG: hypothetical protein DRH13_06085 [Candidatus Woesebacteria bacterium]